MAFTLIVDSNYLCYRAWHSMKSRTEKSKAVLFGFMRDLKYLRNRFSTDNIVFCWDSKYNLRKEMLSSYKTRNTENKEEEKEKSEIHKQIVNLRQNIIPGLGYRNSILKHGYEADDIICMVRDKLNKKNKFRGPTENTQTIVSGDKDLYQLLDNYTDIYNPLKRQVITATSFFNEFGIYPKSWLEVKALVGDKSDNLLGVPGVGVTTAIQYLKGYLKEDSVIYRKIQDSTKIIERNIDLMGLPFEGCPPVFIKKQPMIDSMTWDRIWGSYLGMNAIQQIIPLQRGLFDGADN